MIFLILLSLLHAEDIKKITICVDPNWKPFEWIDEKGNYAGMGHDFLEAFLKDSNLSVQLYRTKNWAESIEAIKAKKCDMLPMAGITQEREKFLNFTKPYYYAPYVIATTSDKVFIDDIRRRLDKTYGVVKDSAVFDDLKKLYPGIKLVAVESVYDGLQRVSNGELYGFINMAPTIAYNMQEHAIIDIKISAKLSTGYKLATAVRKDNTALYKIMSKLVDKLDESTKTQIEMRWLSLIKEEKVDYSLIYKILFVFAFILAGIAYRHFTLKRLNRQLEKKVEEKTQELQKLNQELEAKVIKKTKELIHQSNYDLLTGLPNRVLFLNRLEKAIENAKSHNKIFGLLFIDIDKFQSINESFGYNIGDEVLKAVSQKFLTLMSESDTLSRLSGDELTIIVENPENIDTLTQLAQHILELFKKPIIVGKENLYISVSIGISIYPRDAHTSKDILKNADAAMHRAKEKGRNNFQYYSAVLTKQASERLKIQVSLLQAIENKEFVVYYQPQIDIVQNKLLGMEALVRWKKEGEMISPAEFIPLAEESGLIVEIDRLVMDMAIAQFSQWCKAGLEPGTLSLNLAVKHLESDFFISMLRKKIKKYNFDTKRLELEVTESDLMKDTQKVIRDLHAIHALGIHIALDDFGTGYSSLSYLKKLPIDKLKIDQSFVRDIPDDEEDSAIVKAIIAMAKSLGLTTIAEGVETQSQREFLYANGCESIQGYFYSKPIPAKEMEAFMKSFNA
ncbi:EAL domain-containing protein [Sulfurimonas paralvinellae]|uniref:EAL domain-containing protein n=1 Tax=Sulfurimonas paralvinellae TaxID=317658 RepID=UPI0018661E39|nr:EAL domain-containing protein [Sulfurimonas paralvinellae]